jgi:hypothetical protein
MPEVKNTFIQSKMNKDMDGRIIPNGQYRDGRNIQISKSEGDDVGALENVLGNSLINNFNLSGDNIEIIGHLMADTLDTIFLFITNYTDSSPDQLSHNSAGFNVNSYIISYNVLTTGFEILVEGSFLNFSKTHPVIGVTLIEDLLFFTDNRNQPRKINVNLAQPGYYTTEDQISVAKYYPYAPILLLNKTENSNQNYRYESSMRDVVSEYLPIHAAALVASVNGGNVVLEGHYTNIMPNTPGANISNGDVLTSNKIKIKNCYVESISFSGNQTTISVPADIAAEILPADIVYFQRQNPDYVDSWPGDPVFLKDKFVRFSYRFKFVDGEYSLSAPFTQIAFVPEQDGYFIGDNAINSTTTGQGGLQAQVGQEGETYDSTVVKFMQNKINDIILNIPSPTTGNSNNSMLWSEAFEKLKITEVDILYKDAGSNKTTIIDTLTQNDFSNLQQNILTYNYQSRKPWKTLPPVQTTRVTDIVPIRALSQASSGNRIIYGNFIDKHSSPINLNYSIQANEKVSLPVNSQPIFENSDYYVRKEYQNHTLKQNRTYQVGIILSDRYGRQSNVILSSIINTTVPGYNGSTFYHRYASTEDHILEDKYPKWENLSSNITQGPSAPYSWPGDQISATFWSIIPELKTQDGYPGIYSVADGTITAVEEVEITNGIVGGPCGPYTVTIEGAVKSGSGPTATIQFSVQGTDIIDIVVISSGSGWLSGQAFQGTLTNIPILPGCENLEGQSISGFVVTAIDNPLGWYSYKFVIKQTQQEYYNVYLPGALAGYPCEQEGEEPETIGITDPSDTVTTTGSQVFPTVKFEYPKLQTNHTSHIVLFGDNINKVPKDLQDVGPLTEKFRSSQQLFGRVNVFVDDDFAAGSKTQSNKQYDPGSNPDTVVQIGNMTKLRLGDLVINPIEPTLPSCFYQAETNPLIGRVEVNNKFGIEAATVTTLPTPCDEPYPVGPCLAVYETKPVESLLDIFWETTTSGLISELNESIKNEDNGTPVGLTRTNISWSEGDGYGTYISRTFEGAGAYGQGLGNSCTIELVKVMRGDGQDVSLQFELEEQGVNTGEYQLKIAPYDRDNNYGFMCWQRNDKNQYTFTLRLKHQDPLGTNPNIVLDFEEEGFITNETPVEGTGVGYTRQQIKDAVYNRTGLLTPSGGGIIPNWMSGEECNTDENFGYQVVPYGRIISQDDFITNKVNTNGDGIKQQFGRDPWWGGPVHGGAGLNLYNWTRSFLCPDGRVPNPIYYGAGCSDDDAITFNTQGEDEYQFEAANGSYGSNPNTPSPYSAFNGGQMKYTVKRMYQVSMYLGNGSPDRKSTYASTSIGDFTYSWDQPLWLGFSSGANPGCGDCGPLEIIFGYNNYIPAANSVTGQNELVDGIPTSPIYWDFDANQLIDANGGESRVGKKHNNNLHYWPDLRWLADQQAAFPNPMGLDMMQLQNGYNTFYHHLGPKAKVVLEPLARRDMILGVMRSMRLTMSLFIILEVTLITQVDWCLRKMNLVCHS